MQTYAAERLSHGRLAAAAASIAWEAYGKFLETWMFSPVFVGLFTLPYKTLLKLPASLEATWTTLIDELSKLLTLVRRDWKSPADFRFLDYWLRRVHEAGRWMGLHFSLWIIENFGRVDAPDDYDRGPDAWRRLLPRLLKSQEPSRPDKAAAKSLLDDLESRGKNPDEFWAIPCRAYH